MLKYAYVFVSVNAHCTCDKLAVSISTCIRSVQKQYMHTGNHGR